MWVFWLFGAISVLCFLVVLAANPPLLAATLTVAGILTPYYLLHERHTMTDTETLTVEQRDGQPYITTAPLPEHLQISPELWDEASMDPDAGDRNWIWVETIDHADPDRDNDGWMLHVDASNVQCAYRVASLPDDGPIRGTLASWTES